MSIVTFCSIWLLNLAVELLLSEEYRDMSLDDWRALKEYCRAIQPNAQVGAILAEAVLAWMPLGHATPCICIAC